MKAILIERCAICPYIVMRLAIANDYRTKEAYHCGLTYKSRRTIENVPRWCPLDNVRITAIRKTDKVKS